MQVPLVDWKKGKTTRLWNVRPSEQGPLILDNENKTHTKKRL